MLPRSSNDSSKGHSPRMYGNPNECSKSTNPNEMSTVPAMANCYFEEYVSTRDLGRLNSGDNVEFWFVAPRLADLQAEHGDPTRAREGYRLFLDATEGADPEFQPKRERAAAALEALGN